MKIKAWTLYRDDNNALWYAHPPVHTEEDYVFLNVKTGRWRKLRYMVKPLTEMEIRRRE